MPKAWGKARMTLSCQDRMARMLPRRLGMIWPGLLLPGVFAYPAVLSRSILISGLLLKAAAPSWERSMLFSGKKVCHNRSEEHTSELQSLMRISYAVFCLKKKKKNTIKIVHY